MTAQHVLTIDFGVNGNSLGYLGGGWARAEEGFAWMTGQESHLLLNLEPDGREYVLTLRVAPFILPPGLRAQRLVVSLNETTIGMGAFSRPVVLGWRIPGHLIRPGRSLITLSHPDAARPSDLVKSTDERELAFSVEDASLHHFAPPAVGGPPLPAGLSLGAVVGPNFAVHPGTDLREWVARRTGLSLAELAMQFESIGDNCEFGLVQRKCDAEPLGLLRFSGAFSDGIVAGIENDFAGLGEPETIEPRLEDAKGRREYMIHERTYGLTYHSFVYEDERTPDVLRKQEAARLTFLRRKFLDDLEEGEKIFVFKRNVPVPEAELLPLFMALNRKRANSLLWVVPAEPGRPCGTVEVAMPGLLKGHIDRFAPNDNAHDFSFEAWIRLCANALLLNRLMRGTGGTA